MTPLRALPQHESSDSAMPPNRDKDACRLGSNEVTHRSSVRKLYEFTYCDGGECRVAALPLLYEISSVVSENLDLSGALSAVLSLMQLRMKIVRGIVSLFDRKSGEIFVHESFGLSGDQKARGVYSVGEGITGRAVQSGDVIIVPRIGDEPRFLSRTSDGMSDPDASFVCVPIAVGKKVLGTIGAERRYENTVLLRQDAELLATVAAIIAPSVELFLLKGENIRLRSELKERFQPTNLIGTSKPMLDVYKLVHRIAPTKTTVLVLGESGVGKELIANAIHYGSPMASGPFVKFNCASLPENIVESELFGHEKGAFTGASAQRKGRFELASGGTIFLDEVGELSPSVQAKLLRVLQERTFERVGGNRPISVDLRIIAATNRNLVDMVATGHFREDLFYRLNVFPITIPPLRDRGSDVITLADHFVERASSKCGKSVKRISTPALDMLMSYHWPGNVRELENVIERAVILSDDEVIHQYDLPPSLQTASESGTAFNCSLEAKLQAVEQEMIVEALKTHQGNMTEAAKELGLTRRILGLRMAKYDIHYQTFRGGRGDIESGAKSK